eukprot:TRINITY_DN14387_c0_g1_i1.p1 TRINITY_DN14387_c0_g1~~TRINITY_DN14387_c0_g1_i1.p1  ORF type:complete len:529 (+),score=63.69 TRINITY_DN14387_c0_g1_i1:423-2009(+)
MKLSQQDQEMSVLVERDDTHLRAKGPPSHANTVEVFPTSGIRRSYVVEPSSGKILWEDKYVETPLLGENSKSSAWSLPQMQHVKSFLLPAGYPETVCPEYLTYMLWQLPVHVSGWASSTLVTSSLLQAVGITDASASTTAAATAAIKWVLKDGIGAIGRLLIGGRFGSLFDGDPKQWRMYADLIGSFGMMFEVATALKPRYFMLLATIGNLLVALAHGLKEPSLRVIQMHFALNDNIGDVVAKEDVWDVVGQLVGMGCGILLLCTTLVSSSYWHLVTMWALLRILHLCLRYRALCELRLLTLNLKRSSLLVRDHVAGGTVPGLVECNTMERILVPAWWAVQPRMLYGSSLSAALGGAKTTESAEALGALQSLYAEEDYLMVFHTPGGRCSRRRQQARVVLKEGATSMALLRSLWQAEWVAQHYESLGSLSRGEDPSDDKSSLLGHASRSQDETTSQPVETQALREVKEEGDDLTTSGPLALSLLKASLHAMQKNFPEFLEAMQRKGWCTDKIVIRAPAGTPRLVRVAH